MMRLRQGVRAIDAWLRPSRPTDEQLAAVYLTPPLLALFQQMRAGERQHSLNVLRAIQAKGETNRSLLIAALLHDVGKACFPFWLWERALVVLIRAIMPRRVSRWGDAAPIGWRRPFVISKQHPAWSADQAAAVGADPLSVELIARHQRKLDHMPLDETERLLAVLQSADDAN